MCVPRRVRPRLPNAPPSSLRAEAPPTMSLKSLLFLGLVAARAIATWPCAGDADASKCPEDQQVGDELCYLYGLPASCCYANSDLGRTPYCGNWDMVTCQDDDDGCDTDLYWCCNPDGAAENVNGISVLSVLLAMILVSVLLAMALALSTASGG